MDLTKKDAGLVRAANLERSTTGTSSEKREFLESMLNTQEILGESLSLKARQEEEEQQQINHVEDDVRAFENVDEFSAPSWATTHFLYNAVMRHRGSSLSSDEGNENYFSLESASDQPAVGEGETGLAEMCAHEGDSIGTTSSTLSLKSTLEGDDVQGPAKGEKSYERESTESESIGTNSEVGSTGKVMSTASSFECEETSESVYGDEDSGAPQNNSIPDGHTEDDRDQCTYLSPTPTWDIEPVLAQEHTKEIFEMLTDPEHHSFDLYHQKNPSISSDEGLHAGSSSYQGGRPWLVMPTASEYQPVENMVKTIFESVKRELLERAASRESLVESSGTGSNDESDQDPQLSSSSAESMAGWEDKLGFEEIALEENQPEISITFNQELSGRERENAGDTEENLEDEIMSKMTEERSPKIISEIAKFSKMIETPTIRHSPLESVHEQALIPRWNETDDFIQSDDSKPLEEPSEMRVVTMERTKEKRDELSEARREFILETVLDESEEFEEIPLNDINLLVQPRENLAVIGIENPTFQENDESEVEEDSQKRENGGKEGNSMREMVKEMYQPRVKFANLEPPTSGSPLRSGNWAQVFEHCEPKSVTISIEEETEAVVPRERVYIEPVEDATCDFCAGIWLVLIILLIFAYIIRGDIY